MATYLDRTFTAGNRRTLTFSAWIKRTDNANTYNHLITTSPNPGNWDSIRIENDGEVGIHIGGDTYQLHSNKKIEDTCAWWHICVAIDTTQGTAANRVKMWINGQQISGTGTGEYEFSTASYPTQDFDTNFNDNGKTCRLFDNTWSTGNEYFTGGVAFWYYIDGTAMTAADFGQTDSTTGQWTIKTNLTGLSYGTNGFFLFQDDGAITDDSGQGNNFSSSGEGVTDTKDCPSDNYCQLDRELIPNNFSSNATLSYCGLNFFTSTAQWDTQCSSFGITKGKYYFEVQMSDFGGDMRMRWGLVKESLVNRSGNNSVLGGTGHGAAAFYTGGESSSNGGYIVGETSTALTGDGDINAASAYYGFAVDLDNTKIYGSFNGTWLNSANPSTGTNGIDYSSYATAGTPMFAAFTVHNSLVKLNFGQGAFSGVQVTSNSGNGYQDANGNGKFQNTVPTGFCCISTKGLNQ